MAEAMGFLHLLLLQEIIERGRLRIRRRRLRDATNPLEMPESTFQKLFCISRTIAHELCTSLRTRLERRRTCGLPVHVKVLTAVRFYATGSFQTPIGQDCAIALSQASVSNCVRSVSHAICEELLHRWVKFPETDAERRAITQRFLDSKAFPNTLGCIGCTHIAIMKPRTNEESFKNLHGFYSLNVQMVCDQDLTILNCNAGNPGSVDDQVVFNCSRVKDEMMKLHSEGDRVCLLGDAEYALEPLLLNPMRYVAADSLESLYNEAHWFTWGLMDRLFGVLRSRWQCLLRRRALHLSPLVAAQVVDSCVVLHNMTVRHQLPLPELIVPEEPLPRLYSALCQSEDIYQHFT